MAEAGAVACPGSSAAVAGLYPRHPEHTAQDGGSACVPSYFQPPLRLVCECRVGEQALRHGGTGPIQTVGAMSAERATSQGHARGDYEELLSWGSVCATPWSLGSSFTAPSFQAHCFPQPKTKQSQRLVCVYISRGQVLGSDLNCCVSNRRCFLMPLTLSSMSAVAGKSWRD